MSVTLHSRYTVTVEQPRKLTGSLHKCIIEANNRIAHRGKKRLSLPLAHHLAHRAV